MWFSNKIMNATGLKQPLNAPQADNNLGFVGVLWQGRDLRYCDANGKMVAIPLPGVNGGTGNKVKIIAHAQWYDTDAVMSLCRHLDENSHITSLVLDAKYLSLSKNQFGTSYFVFITEYLCNNATITSVYFDRADQSDVSNFNHAIKNSNNTTLKHVAFRAYHDSCLPFINGEYRTTVYNLDATRAKRNICSIM